MSLSVHPANPLGILLANVLSPALVKKEDDIPMVVRELMCAPTHMCACLCVVCACVYICGVCMFGVHTYVHACVVGSSVHECVHTCLRVGTCPSLCPMGQCTRSTGYFWDFSLCARPEHLLSIRRGSRDQGVRWFPWWGEASVREAGWSRRHLWEGQGGR